jgi:hypothetical protein
LPKSPLAYVFRLSQNVSNTSSIKPAGGVIVGPKSVASAPRFDRSRQNAKVYKKNTASKGFRY